MITVPRALDGLDASYATVAEVIRIVSAADPCIGQIPQNHLGVAQAIRTTADEAQQALLLGAVLRGVRFGNAFSEFGSRNTGVFETTIQRRLAGASGADRRDRYRGPRRAGDRRAERTGAHHRR